ncbi:hypothetical protein FRX31_033925 [Thalictrum thalictroides]|uniref:Uncharacterized protein n=1 Tax=Thalictrum thalictroides TaxID=46969 RepID=A0A7J6UWC0_THATH|nr:hypothetical protein FRX31_033925 [Thalictrum thalictroides]
MHVHELRLADSSKSTPPRWEGGSGDDPPQGDAAGEGRGATGPPSTAHVAGNVAAHVAGDGAGGMELGIELARVLARGW